MKTPTPIIITIDGPVASGKSSVAKKLAEKLGFYYLNTGYLYRALAYVLKDVSEPTASQLTCLDDILYRYDNNKAHVLYKNQDITQHLFDPAIEQQSSKLSAQPEVREALLTLQRSIAQKHSLVTDGRDCGSVVFPDAAAKFFLTADVAIRAARLMQDKKRSYASMSLDQVIAQVNQRDQRDRTRIIAPLVIPKGAMVIDNSDMTQQETLTVFLQHLSRQLSKFTTFTGF
jgi:cytidylate kinase